MKTKYVQSLALEIRSEVGLDEHDVFDPHLFTELYGIAVHQLSEVQCSAEAREYFAFERAAVFSGALIPLSSGLVIVENDNHELVRRKSTLCHEVAHVALEHEFGLELATVSGCGMTDKEQEREAAQLSGELMITFDGARRMAFKQLTDEEVAVRHKVSNEVAAWRMNGSGARKIAARSMSKNRSRT